MKIYVRVRSNIARRQERNINYVPELEHIFPYPTNNPFITLLLHTRHYHKKLNNISNLKNNIFIKQTKIEILNESTPIVATSVSKAVT